jgi:hypothetical protein
MLNNIVVIAPFNTSLLICLKKWGVLDLYQAYCRPWMRYVIGPVECFFCLAVRLAALFCIVLCCLWGWDWHYALIPFCAAPITTFLTTALIYDGSSNQR